MLWKLLLYVTSEEGRRTGLAHTSIDVKERNLRVEKRKSWARSGDGAQRRPGEHRIRILRWISKVGVIIIEARDYYSGCTAITRLLIV